MDTTSSDGQYPLAVKMMFNYDVESNASTIMRAMQRETVPAKNVGADIRDLTRDMVHLEHHPNIVNMVTVFADQVRKWLYLCLLYTHPWIDFSKL